MLFDCPVFTCCYEGDATPDAAAAAQQAAAQQAAAAAAAQPKTFTQDDVNTMLAKERRKGEATLKQIAEQHEKNLKDAMAQQGLTEQKRAELQGQLDEVQAKLYSAEELHKQQLAKLRNDADMAAKQATAKAQEWEQRFTSSTVARDLQDAAVKGEAFNADQLVTLLKPATKIVPVTDAQGQPTGQYQTVVEVSKNGTKELMTPAKAIEWMKGLPAQFGNLFKSGAATGVGANSSPALQPGQSGPIDWSNMTQAQYEALRKDPDRAKALLGTRR